MKVLVTGYKGFIGRNLVSHLQRQDDIRILGYDIDSTQDELFTYLDEADFVYHLAGVNRPKRTEEFFEGNTDLTRLICNRLARRPSPPPILFSSSIQAELDNPYGRSKRLAEEVLVQYAREFGGISIIYRLTNVFGKWSRPNYNTVVATFCYNISHDLPIIISDPNKEIRLIHIDDVVKAFIAELRNLDSTINTSADRVIWRKVSPEYPITLGRLAEIIRSFRAMLDSLYTPDFSDPFIRKLYGMYLTYLDEDDLAYNLQKRCDDRGCLAEFMKSVHFGQIFVSRTKPGAIRGNHYHHSKAEKFLVLDGEAIIRFRPIFGDSEQVIEYRVTGDDFRVLDIPPGYTHSIENIGDRDVITLFWADEVFDPENPDTYYEEV